MYYTTFDDNEIVLKTIDDIYKIQNPENVKLLYLYHNNLTHLDKELFSNLTQLQKLWFGHNNNLTHLDKDLFKYNTQLQRLSLSNNKLTHLDKDIFKYNTQLQELDLSWNKLTHLDKDLFKYNTQLKKLDLSDNKLTHLDKDIFTNLTQLQYLYLNNNNLTHLDKELFSGLTQLQELHLYNNNLTHLPSITRCTNLTKFLYYNNEIDYIPPHIQRFLNNLRQQSNNLQIYNDSQNVHNHTIQESIKNSLENILNVPKTINKDSLIQNLLKSNMNQKSIKLLLKYCQNDSVHSVLNITFEETLFHILEYINLELKEHKNEIYSILETEILDSEYKCFTGRISRLINCLNGFTPLVEIKIPDNMEISNIIVMMKQNYKGNDENELKDLIKKELQERNYSKEVIEEYLEFVEL
jgi:Leucine-rich repeat (LRR) protein